MERYRVIQIYLQTWVVSTITPRSRKASLGEGDVNLNESRILPVSKHVINVC